MDREINKIIDEISDVLWGKVLINRKKNPDREKHDPTEEELNFVHNKLSSSK